MQKQAKVSWKDVLIPAAAGAGGGAVGYNVSPYIFGYEASPTGRRVSGLEDAALAATLTALARRGHITPKQLALGATTGYAATQAVPVTHSILGELRSKATEERTTAEIQKKMQEAARNAPTTLQQFAASPITRGAGIGAAGAGLAAILTGLARKRTEEEMKNRASRMGMIGSDVLKYVLPAMVAGGVAGSFVPK
jgi:hypothetical protein